MEISCIDIDQLLDDTIEMEKNTIYMIDNLIDIDQLLENTQDL